MTTTSAVRKVSPRNLPTAPNNRALVARHRRRARTPCPRQYDVKSGFAIATKFRAGACRPGGSGAGGSLVRRERGVHDRLRFLHDAGQVLFAAKALRIDLVDLFRARRPGNEPATLRDHLDPA